MKTKFEKLEQSSSSSSSSSSEEDVEEDGEDNNRIKKEIELEEINNKDEANNNTDSINNNKDKIEPSEQENELEINKNLLTPQNEPETNSISKAEQQQIDSLVDTNKNLMSDGDSSSSPFINSNNSNYNDSPAVNYSNKNEDRTIENYSLSSPNSNSPLYLNNSNLNNTNNHYLPGSTATHVTIKSFTKKSIQPVIKAFADEDDEANGPQLKRPKLIGSLNDQESKMNSDERKKAVKKLVESIPTDRDDLFSYVIDWDQLDEALMDKRIKPWINKKIIEYIGEEEATLNDFICTKIQQRTKPERLLEEVKVILDDEAELFIKKMWRLIVYETESKRQGLSK
jgi:RNA-binding protein 25